MDPFVPKHGPRPLDGQTCGYSPTRVEADYCGRPATWHVMWDRALDNSFTCDEHMRLVEARWVFDDRHRVVADCGMPGALWWYRDGCCRVPGSAVEGAAAAAVEHLVGSGEPGDADTAGGVS
jgi:hypothetical protein